MRMKTSDFCGVMILIGLMSIHPYITYAIVGVLFIVGGRAYERGD